MFTQQQAHVYTTTSTCLHNNKYNTGDEVILTQQFNHHSCVLCVHICTARQNGHHLCRENLFQLSCANLCVSGQCHYRLLSISWCKLIGVISWVQSHYILPHFMSVAMEIALLVTMVTKGGMTESHACNKVVYNSQHLPTTTDRRLLSICVVCHRALVCDRKQVQLTVKLNTMMAITWVVQIC